MHIRAALRSLLGMPSFALAVVLTIALGVGATSAMFSAVYAALLRPLPYPDAERLIGRDCVDHDGCATRGAATSQLMALTES